MFYYNIGWVVVVLVLINIFLGVFLVLVYMVVWVLWFVYFIVVILVFVFFEFFKILVVYEKMVVILLMKIKEYLVFNE